MKLSLKIENTEYTFTLYPLETQFNRIAGVYTFFIIPDTRHPASDIQQYSFLYLGITNNFQSRLRQHHKIKQAIELGMNHIGILKINSGRKRKNLERKLLKNYNPPLNQTWLYDQNLTSNV